ncbi:MAG: helix-turn-helix transcriptional regulator [Bacilli bacterium]|nr:helix-turn-helix transcriptional regulator [Bacilli bacterium]
MSKRKIVEEISEEYKERLERLDSLEQEFVDSVVKLRKDKKLTQQEVADDASVIRETIARIENRITSPQVNTLLKILEPFGYTIKITKISKKKEN